MGILGTIDPFSPVGRNATSKVLLLGSPDPRFDPIRSLPIEHVSPGKLSREISPADPVALLRKWFFGRKPDAGFLLAGFPATLLHARMFDEWLEARHEALDAVFAGPDAPEGVVRHYRAFGLLLP